MESYSKTIVARVSTETAYKAITEEMSDWWTPMSGKFLKIGDLAQTDFGGKSYWKFEAQTLNAPNLLELRCCAANHIHEGLSLDIKEEWLGSVLQFKIQDKNEKLNITLTHQGLTPDLTCYEVCEQGWDQYCLDSLLKFLNEKEQCYGH